MNVSISPPVCDDLCPNITNQELRLSEFIKFTLQQARIGRYPSNIAMQLLDRAWEAQKLLWQLRNQRILNEYKTCFSSNMDEFKSSTS